MLEGSFIKSVQSPSHPIAISMGTLSTASSSDPVMSKASATLALGSSALDKDFVLIVQSKSVGIPKALLETHPTIPNQRALMVTLVPKFSLPPTRPEIVFVADRSGSMVGNIPMLVTAMEVFLKSMPTGVKFNICSFGYKSSFLWPKSQSYTQESLTMSNNHLKNFGADMGGTETFGAVQATIERRHVDLPLEIILITDGNISGQNELFAYVNAQVQESDHNIRVFPLGIGNGVSHALIEGLARAGDGFAQAVQNGERIDTCVVRMLRGALSPHVKDYTLEVKYEPEDSGISEVDYVTEGFKVLLSDDEGSVESEKSLQPEKRSLQNKPAISLFDMDVDPEKEDLKVPGVSKSWLPHVPHPKLLQAPHKIPTLYAFSRTTAYLLLSSEACKRKPKSIVLRGTSAHGLLELEIDVEALPTGGKTIHQLAAKKAVQDLEEGRGWLYDAKDQHGVLVKDRYPSRFDELIEQEAVRLGEKFQIAGKWCSFIAVAVNDEEIESGETNDEVSMRDFGKLSLFNVSTFADTSTDKSSSSSGIDEPVRDRKLRDVKSERKVYSPAHTVARPAQDLQDYQMQGMVLEQQNKKRLMMARQEQDPASPAPPGYSARAIVASVFTQSVSERSRPTAQPRRHLGSKAARRSVPSTGGVKIPPHSNHSMQLRSSSSQTNRGVPSAPGSALFNSSAAVNTGQPVLQPPVAFGAQIGSFGSSTAQPTPLSRGAFPAGVDACRASSQSFGSSAAGNSAQPAPQSGGLFGNPFRPPIQVSSIFGPSSASMSLNAATPQQGSRLFGSISSNTWDNSSPAPAPAATVPRTLQDKVHALITIQQSNGSWLASAAAEIATIFGWDCMDWEGKSGDGQDGRGGMRWVTLLVLCWLEEKAGDEGEVWGLVVEKARDWLMESGDASSDLVELERKARNEVKRH